MRVAPKSLQPRLAVASLVVGPLLAAAGDLMHPEEDSDAADQVAILLDHTSRWYGAHLFLLIGILVFVPGFLAITHLAASRSPKLGYLGRVFILIGVASFAAIFGFEMLLGRYARDGAGEAAATALLETFQSGQVVGVLLPFGLAFFMGIGLTMYVLARKPGPLRWPAVTLAGGAALILVEIVSSKVVFSQVGNVLLLVSGIGFASFLFRHDEAVS